MLTITIYIFINILALFLIAWFARKDFAKQNKIQMMTSIAVTLVTLLIFIYIAVFLQSDTARFDQASLGQFGDYWGGILNPVIGIISVFLLYNNIRVSKELESLMRGQTYTDYMMSSQNHKLKNIQDSAIEIMKISKSTKSFVCTFTNISQLIDDDSVDGTTSTQEEMDFAEFCKNISFNEGYYFKAYCDYNEDHKIKNHEFIAKQIKKFTSSNIEYSNFTNLIDIHCRQINRYIDTTSDTLIPFADDFISAIFQASLIKSNYSAEEVGYRNIFLVLLANSIEFNNLYKKCVIKNIDYDFYLTESSFRFK